jgi:hypothetical protein
LCTAIERNWWPAIVEELLTVAITDADGVQLIPRPRQSPDLGAFIAANDFLATSNMEGTEGSLRFKRFAFQAMTIDDSSYSLGDLALVADPDSWTFLRNERVGDEDGADDGEGDNGSAGQVSQRSLVALVRGPRMVVEYSDRGQTPPFVRGVFVASADIDDLLRQTEPKGHDRWQTEASSARASHPHATRIAKSLDQRINRMVRDFRKMIDPPPVKPEGARLDVFDRLMARLLRGRSKTPPPPRPKRPISISFPYERVVPAADGLCKLKASIRLALSENAERDSAQVEIQVDYAFLSDAPRSKEDRPELELALPPGLTATRAEDGVYVVSGQLDRAPVTVAVESEPYPSDWTGELRVAAELARQPSEEVSVGD